MFGYFGWQEGSNQEGRKKAGGKQEGKEEMLLFLLENENPVVVGFGVAMVLLYPTNGEGINQSRLVPFCERISGGTGA